LFFFNQGYGQTKPNVIIVMTDDQGYGEMSCHGNPVLKTPHIDKLAEQSTQFSDFHVSPMCASTRGQLLTGLNAAKNGCVNVSSGRGLLRKELPTLADIFSDNGYKTGVFDKWHLGDNYPYRPQDRGFEESIWFPSSHIGSVPDSKYYILNAENAEDAKNSIFLSILKGKRMRDIYLKLLGILMVFVLILGCKDSVTDQKKDPVNYPRLTNEPRSPDAAEIVYDMTSGIFGNWGTDMSQSGCNYYISPGSRTWEKAMARSMSNTEWWEEYNGLYAGGVPGGTTVNGQYMQAYSCQGAIGIMRASGTPRSFQWTDLGEPVVSKYDFDPTEAGE
jgi:hypothetical protein